MEDASRVNESLEMTADVTHSQNESHETPTPTPTPTSTPTRSPRLHSTDAYFNEGSSQPICQFNTTAYNSFHSLSPLIESNESDSDSEGLNTMSTSVGTNYSFVSSGSASGIQSSDHDHPISTGASSNDGTITARLRSRVRLMIEIPAAPVESTPSINSTVIRQQEPFVSSEIQRDEDAFAAFWSSAARSMHAHQNSDEDESDGHQVRPVLRFADLEWIIQHLRIKGLTEEQIVGNMKTQIYTPANADTTVEPNCCICWDDYDSGQTLGVLDCGGEHHFHSDCIKSWLLVRNSCPLCRMVGLIIH